MKKEDIIRKRFSQAAPRYGILSQVQRGVAAAFATRFKGMKGAYVLDVGAGDGALTKVLGSTDITLVSLDSAWGMVRLGRASGDEKLWVQADACALPFRGKSFDMLVSSSAYQWVGDLRLAFIEAKRVLKPGGRLMVAMFGRATLTEFFESLETAAGKLDKPLPPIRRLADETQVRQALRSAGFKKIEMGSERREVLFVSVTALLVWLKGIGANTLATNFFWGKGLLAATEKEYRARFLKGEQLRASFEVVWIEART